MEEVAATAVVVELVEEVAATAGLGLAGSFSKVTVLGTLLSRPACVLWTGIVRTR